MGEQSTARRDSGLPEGVERRAGKRGARLRVTFPWLGERRRETLDIPDTPANVKYAGRLRAEVLNAIERGTFEYARFFPNSKTARLQQRGRARHLLNDLVDSYLADARNAGVMSPSSVATYVKWARARIKPKFAGRFADDISTKELRGWIAELAKDLAPKSVRNIVGLLSIIFSLAVPEIIPTSPLAPIKLKTLIPRRAREEDDIDPFNAEEIAAILDACDSVHERCLFQYAFGSGARTGELIALKWPHVDWLGHKVRIKDNVVSAERGTVEKGTKTGNVRDVPLLPGAEAALLAMKPLSLLKQTGGYVFLHPSGGRWRNDQQIRDRWEIILRRAGVRYRKPYQTRHTFASTLLMNGEPELLVAMLLGHTTVEMVRRNYGRYIKQADGKVSFRGDYSAALGAAPSVPQIKKGAA